MPRTRQPSPEDLNEIMDPMWSAAVLDEYIDSDPERYFRLAWALCHLESERQITEQDATAREREQKRPYSGQPRHVAERRFAAGVLRAVRTTGRTAKHRAGSDV